MFPYFVSLTERLHINLKTGDSFNQGGNVVCSCIKSSGDRLDLLNYLYLLSIALYNSLK